MSKGQKEMILGKELITKYHVPFILIEFCKGALRNQNTSSSQFLNLFYNKGNRLSSNGFFLKILKI